MQAEDTSTLTGARAEETCRTELSGGGIIRSNEMDTIRELTEELAFFDEMEKEFDTMKNKNKRLEEILFCKEKQLREAKETILNLEKEIERIFQFGIGILSNKEKELNDANERIAILKQEMNKMTQFGMEILSKKDRELNDAKRMIACLEQKITIMDIRQDSISGKNRNEKRISYGDGGNGSQSNALKNQSVGVFSFWQD